MRVEMDLCDFEPWCGAVGTYNTIKNGGKLEELEMLLEKMYPDGLTITELNDELWFGGQDLLRILGFRTTDQVEEELDEARRELNELNLAYKEEVKELASSDSANRDFRDELDELYLRGYLDDIKEIEARISELESELEGCDSGCLTGMSLNRVKLLCSLGEQKRLRDSLDWLLNTDANVRTESL